MTSKKFVGDSKGDTASQVGIGSMAVEDDAVKQVDDEDLDGKPKRKNSKTSKRRKTLTIQDEHGVEREAERYIDDQNETKKQNKPRERRQSRRTDKKGYGTGKAS